MRLKFYYPEVWFETDDEGDEEQFQITKTHWELCHRSKMKLILRGWSKCLTTCLICWLFCIIWQQIITMWLSRRLSPRQSSTWQPAEVNLRNGVPHLKVKMQPQRRLVSQATKAWARWSEYILFAQWCFILVAIHPSRWSIKIHLFCLWFHSTKLIHPLSRHSLINSGFK
jgi:hypothetical protein